MDRDFKKKFLKGSAATFIGQASSMIFHFISLMILTRVIPKEDFGIYALIIVITNMFIVLSGLGLDVTLVKFLSSNVEKEVKSIFAKIIRLKGVSLVFFVVIFLFIGDLFLPLFDIKLIDYKIYIILLFILGNFRDLFFKVLQAVKHFKKYAFLQITSAFSRILLILYFYLQGDLNLFTLVLVEVSTVIIVLLVGLILIPFNTLMDKNLKTIRTKEIMNFTLPIYFNNIFGFMQSRINIFIIGAFLNPLSVAYYNVGGRLPVALKKMFDSFILVFFPNLSNLFSKGDRKSAKELVNKSLIVVSMILSVIVLVSFLFSTEIITLLFSDRYVESSWVFSLLMLNFTLTALANLLGYTNLSAGYPKVPMKVNLVSSVLSIGGALYLIPKFGYVGAAYSLIFMNAIAQVLYILYLRKINLVIEFLLYVKPIIILIVAISIYLLIDNTEIITRLSTILIYFILNWFFSSEFRFIINSIVRNIQKIK